MQSRLLVDVTLLPCGDLYDEPVAKRTRRAIKDDSFYSDCEPCGMMATCNQRNCKCCFFFSWNEMCKCCEEKNQIKEPIHENENQVEVAKRLVDKKRCRTRLDKKCFELEEKIKENLPDWKLDKEPVDVLDWLELLLGKAEGIIQIDPNIHVLNDCTKYKIWCKPDCSAPFSPMTPKYQELAKSDNQKVNEYLYWVQRRKSQEYEKHRETIKNWNQVELFLPLYLEEIENQKTEKQVEIKPEEIDQKNVISECNIF